MWGLTPRGQTPEEKSMPAKSLMVLGTASGVGKSVLTAGLCRLLSDAGYKVAPFKAQNMSNNSFVTREGGEIGRAQAVQAECARVLPHTDMNPVLLKPAADDGSQVVIHGKARGHFKAREYFARRREVWAAIETSFGRLREDYDFLILEGAGSPAEVNLKEFDCVNMKVAEMAGAPCLLVSDIDRGGVFASILGTLDLLEPSERGRIAGLVVNKFRGDVSLFEDGVKFLEERTAKKVWGVLPYDRELWIEEEDSVSIERNQSAPLAGDFALDVAVVYLPRISNFTDFEILKHQPGVRLRYVHSVSDFGEPDLLILPGTKATMADYRYLLEQRLGPKIQDFVSQGGRALGICGGFQMMGEWIRDPEHLESAVPEIRGFGFFRMTTEFSPEKVLRTHEGPVEAVLFGEPIQAVLTAYEIHMGRTFYREPYAPFGGGGALHPSGRIIGTYFHGLFENQGFRDSFFRALRKDLGKKTEGCVPSPSLARLKEEHYERLARLLRAHLDLHALENILDCSLNHPLHL